MIGRSWRYGVERTERGVYCGWYECEGRVSWVTEGDIYMTEVQPKYGFPYFCRQSSKTNIPIASSKIIISDIWAFWDFLIKKHNKDKEFLFALLQQAKHFYSVAETSEFKSKPLLYYYSFLNFSKILIHIEKKFPKNAEYTHGVSEKNNQTFIHSEVKIFQSNFQNNNKKSVVYELMEILGEDLSGFQGSHQNANNKTLTLNVKELLSNCVGVHRAYSQVYSLKEHFYKLENITCCKHGKKLIFDSTIKDYSTDLDILYGTTSNNYKVTKLTTDSHPETQNTYFELSKILRNNGIWYFIGNDGYTSYLSSKQSYRYSSEIIIYLTMFYLGSITRYHPYLFDKIFSDKEQWLMSEFLTTQPKQFIFLGTAKFLGANVLKAYSSF